MTVRHAVPWAVPGLWCGGVCGLGYGRSEHDSVAKCFHPGERDVVA